MLMLTIFLMQFSMSVFNTPQLDEMTTTSISRRAESGLFASYHAVMAEADKPETSTAEEGVVLTP